MIKNEDKFMDMEGEDMRRSILMKENEKGERIWMRKELKIKVWRKNIEINEEKKKRYEYMGEVFRKRRDGDEEFLKEGIEDIGDEEEED